MNRVNLIGRITNKPELRYTTNEIAFTRFNLAINQGYGDNKKTDFIPIIVWKKQAENVCNYLDKGSLIAVEGRIQTGVYEDKEGNKKTTFDVVAESVEFLESKKDGQAPVEAVVEETKVESDPFKDFQNELVLTDEDLPFL
jgi:single-strand DNA-binding protein